MSNSFSYDLSVVDPPAEAHARLREAVTDQMRRSANMSLASEDAKTMAFSPPWSWPLLVAATRKARGETIKLSFSAAGSGTQIAVSGKMAGAAEKVASRDFWATTLTAS
jgi:hypothetical protein